MTSEQPHRDEPSLAPPGRRKPIRLIALIGATIIVVAALLRTLGCLDAG